MHKGVDFRQSIGNFGNLCDVRTGGNDVIGNCNNMADINVCSPRMLSAETGISASMAKKIVKYRKREAKIRKFSELWGIEGMNKSVMHSLRSSCVINNGSGTKSRKGNTKNKMKQTEKSYKGAASSLRLEDLRSGTSRSDEGIGLQNTPVTLIIPVCKVLPQCTTNERIFTPQSLQASTSGNKLTAVYHVSPSNRGHVSSAKVNLDALSTTVQPPSTLASTLSSAVDTRPKTLSPSKEQSICRWLNTIPRRSVHLKYPVKIISLPGDLGRDPLLADDSLNEPEQRYAAKNRRSKSKSPPRRKSRSISQERSRSRGRHRKSKTLSRSKSKSRSTTRSVRPRKQSKTSVHRNGKKSLTPGGKRNSMSRGASSSRSRSKSLKRRPPRDRVKSTRKPEEYKTSSYRRVLKRRSRCGKHSLNTKMSEDDRQPLLSTFENPESFQDHSGPLTLYDLENCVVADEMETRSSEQFARTNMGESQDTNPEHGSAGAFDLTTNPKASVISGTPVNHHSRRQRRERSVSREIPRLSRRSLWKTNEEFEMHRSHDQPRERRRRMDRYHRHHHKRCAHRDRERDRLACIIL